jgi:hypothetical protein
LSGRRSSFPGSEDWPRNVEKSAPSKILKTENIVFKDIKAEKISISIKRFFRNESKSFLVTTDNPSR